jgi:hypothetical protein
MAGHLSKKERPEPSPAVKGPDTGVAAVSGDDGFKFSTRNELDELGKYSRLGHGLEILRE